MTKKTSAGLTLIEILTVFAILIILALAGFIAFHRKIDKANDAKRKDDLDRLRTTFEDYYSDHNNYPAADILNTCGGGGLKPYLPSIPCDPTTNLPYCYIYYDDTQTFKILARLQDKTDPVIIENGCNHAELYCGYETECANPAADSTAFTYGVTSTNTVLPNPDLPHPGGGIYIFACTQDGTCNSWDHFPPGCQFFAHQNCDNMCADPNYWCIE